MRFVNMISTGLYIDRSLTEITMTQLDVKKADEARRLPNMFVSCKYSLHHQIS
jgi:hypothetical protein